MNKSIIAGSGSAWLAFAVLGGAALGLGGCDTGAIVAAIPTVNATVQAYTTLNAAALTDIAAANKNDPRVQAVVKSLAKGNAATAVDAQILAAAAPLDGLAINAAAIVGKAIVK